MFKFENIEYLYWLLAILPMAAVFFFYIFWRRRAIKKLGEMQLVERLMPGKPKYKHQVKFLFVMLAFAAACIALANPQMGTKYEKVKREGIDVIVALDVSNSMLAEDVKPNRLDRSKLLVSRLIDKMQNDRVGLIVFAGNAYLQMPLTVDHGASKLFLNTINTNMVPTQGTAISEAIRLSIKAFGQDEKKFKALIIITDGEDNEGDALAAVSEAVENGIVAHTIGVGSPQGAPLPVYKNGIQIDFKRDRQNNIVLSKLNETILQQIAVKGGGSYSRLASGSEDLNRLFSSIASMEKKEIEERVFTDYESWFQIPVAIALLLLTLEFFISERKSAWIGNWKIFQTAEKKA